MKLRALVSLARSPISVGPGEVYEEKDLVECGRQVRAGYAVPVDELPKGFAFPDPPTPPDPPDEEEGDGDPGATAREKATDKKAAARKKRGD